MITDRKYKAQSGLTLAEMLIALLVFSMVAAASITVMRVSIAGRDQLAEVSAGIQEISLARSLLRSDLHQAVNRQTRALYGTDHVPAVTGGRLAVLGQSSGNGQILLTLVRQGNLNPDMVAARSDLQYVEYVLRGEELIRRASLYPDRVGDAAMSERVLLSGVQNARIEFFDGERWRDEFVTARTLLPAALSLTFEHPSYGEIRQVFYTPRIVIGEGGA